MHGNRWFSTLYLESGYWQIAMHLDCEDKTAFTISLGLFQFKVMAFMLCNAPSTFESLMEGMLQGILWMQCIVYLDDIVVFRKTEKQALEHF